MKTMLGFEASRGASPEFSATKENNNAAMLSRMAAFLIVSTFMEVADYRELLLSRHHDFFGGSQVVVRVFLLFVQ